MAGFPKSFKTIEIMQQCKYGFTPEYVEELCGWSVIKDYAWIKHDKDLKDDGSLKEEHIHLMIRFNDAVPTNAILAKLKDVCEVQHLSKMKSWNGAIAYLTHSNAPEKHLYSDDEVKSNFEWTQDRDKALAGSKRLQFIIAGIDNGTIREYNYTQHITMQEYTQYKRQIDTAFKYRTDRLKGANRDMECIFITGESGAGKTTYAKMIAEEKGYSYYVSSGTNDVLDGYAGEDVVILDDLRSSAMGLQDLLKMLDNNTASSVKSRYRNKVLECKLIIITTTQDIKAFFNKVFESEHETSVQLMRRCQTYIRMTQDKMKIYAYNRSTRDYTMLFDLPNPVEFVQREFSAEEALDKIQDLLGGTLKGVKTFAKQKQDLLTEEQMNRYEQGRFDLSKEITPWD